MRRTTITRLGLAAVILFAPGGFILAATLLAHRLRRRMAATRAERGRLGSG